MPTAAPMTTTAARRPRRGSGLLLVLVACVLTPGAHGFHALPSRSALAALPRHPKPLATLAHGPPAAAVAGQEALLWSLGSRVTTTRRRQDHRCGSSSTRLYNSPLLNTLGITELEIVARLLMATMAGAAIGFERRYSERPAGLRTMALVSLGAAIFTIISLGIPGDKSRMAASVASGVGFIGAGVISQNGFEDSSKSGGRRIQQVNGLTTATAIWVSAALGVSSGAGLNLLTFIGAALAVCVLRVGRFTRLLRLRRRDFQKLSQTTLKAISKPPGVPVVVAQPSPPPPPPKQTMLVAGGAGGALHSPPSSDSPYLVKTKAPPPPAARPPAQPKGVREEDSGVEEPALGPSKVALGVPSPNEQYVTTTANGLGSQEIDFGDSGGSGDAGGGSMLFSSSGGEGGSVEGPQGPGVGGLGMGDVALGGGGA